MANIYLKSIQQQFTYYKMLGDKTIASLPGDKLFWHYNEESNPIATIVKHLWGNMLSRWTDFLTSDGEKKWRDRDAEFEEEFKNADEVLTKWNAGWACLFDAINSLREEDLQKQVFIRNEGHTVIEAINRQLAHYSYHVGQIVFIGKMISDGNWVSLSIPRGKSKDFNARKFSNPKNRKDFTSEPGSKST